MKKINLIRVISFAVLSAAALFFLMLPQIKISSTGFLQTSETYYYYNLLNSEYFEYVSSEYEIIALNGWVSILTLVTVIVSGLLFVSNGFSCFAPKSKGMKAITSFFAFLFMVSTLALAALSIAYALKLKESGSVSIGGASFEAIRIEYLGSFFYLGLGILTPISIVLSMLCKKKK